MPVAGRFDASKEMDAIRRHNARASQLHPGWQVAGVQAGSSVNGSRSEAQRGNEARDGDLLMAALC